MLQMDDMPGLLSKVLNQVAKSEANILTIHQSIPINGIALLTLSVEILPQSDSTSVMIEAIEVMDGIHYVKLVSRE
jgi:chorismate mutase